MHTSSCSILCRPSNSSSIFLSHFSPFPYCTPKQPNLSFSNQLRLTSLNSHLPYRSSKLQSTATEGAVQTSPSDSKFIETGYVYGVHGFQGEVRVKTSTDFPELRFSKPGIRWLKQQSLGAETLQEIELVGGRGHPGQSWLVKFSGIDSSEQAQKLVGSVILVKDEDRPDLEEDEFYTNDLIGMKVILKASGEPVGTVVKVFNSGASDLLQVKLKSNRTTEVDQTGHSEEEAVDSGPLVWVPFVEPIVPVVDLENREMLITPPKGLLELNIRTHEKSKKERRELEWKERKKLQRHLIAAKKKLSEMEQQHVFQGFRYGEKDQTSLLANQIVTVNSKLLQQALQNIVAPSTRENLDQILAAIPRSHTLKTSDSVISDSNNMLSDPCCQLQRDGQSLTSNGKAAIFLVLQTIEETNQSYNPDLADSERSESSYDFFTALLNDHQKFVKIEDRSSLPLVLICSAQSLSPLQELFSTHGYFEFNPEKVWFLEEEKLPVVSASQDKHKILMKSPWEFLQRPVGSGGVISSLSSGDLLDNLSDMGVEYIEVCTIDQSYKEGRTLLGLVNSRKADVGIQLSGNSSSEESYDIIFTMSFMKRWVKQLTKLQIEAVLASNSHVEKVDKDWIDVTSPDLNSYEFHCSIFNCLDVVSIDKVCVLDSTK